MIQYIRTWLRGFEPLSNDRLTIDYQPDAIGHHAIYNTTTADTIKTYLSGKDKQFDFVVASCEAYGNQIAGNIENLEFFTELAKWVDEQNKAKNFPVLPDGKTPQKVLVSSSGYLYQTSPDGKARYQMQLKLLYHERRV